MIARIWRGHATPENAEAYYRHVTRTVFPALARIDGHRGGYVLRRETAGRVEIVVATLWASMAAVRAFAGEDPDVAVVEPEARAVLADFDRFVQHYEVVHGSGCQDAAHARE